MNLRLKKCKYDFQWILQIHSKTRIFSPKEKQRRKYYMGKDF